MKKGRECLICGTRYEYCPNCDGFINKPRWMFLYHDENCKDIGVILNDYKAGTKTADEAKTALGKTDLSKKDTFRPAFKAMIDEIMNTPEKEEEDVPVQKKYNNSESNKFSSKKSYKK